MRVSACSGACGSAGVGACGGVTCAPGKGRATDGLVAMPAQMAMQHSHTLGYTLQSKLKAQ